MNKVRNSQPWQIRVANDSDQGKWDTYVSDNPQAGPYHLFAWKKAVVGGYGHKGYYLLAEDDRGECLGVLPLICLEIPFAGRVLVSLPYCDYAGPLGLPEIQKALIDESLLLTQRLAAKSLELRCPQPGEWMRDGSELEGRTFTGKVRMIFSLQSGSSEATWSCLTSKLRSQIRRPLKEGMQARFGGVELLNDFYTPFSINMHKLGSPVHSRRWFEMLLREYGHHAQIGVVYLKTGLAVASGIILTLRGKASLPWASSLKEFNALSPNMMLYWQFMSWAADHGFHEFDMGRSTPGEGTYRFKEQWGSMPKPLYWYERALNGNREALAKIWRKLPLWMADLAGPKIRKYISL